MTTSSSGTVHKGPSLSQRLFGGPIGPHETRGASVVRPVVFGVTDGLVCNLSLIMGVAAAAQEDPHSIVVAGIAGLLAGGFSMAVGEYVSVSSQRELMDYQVNLQKRQLKQTPEQERAILTEIYCEKGLSLEEAELIVDRIMSGPANGLDTFVKEEIGLSEEAVGSPIAAAVGSLLAFAAGAIIPLVPFLVPFLVSLGGLDLPISIGMSVIALFIVGVAVSRLTRRSPIFTGVRQMVLGLAAAAVTYGIGLLFGAAVH